MKKTSTPNNRNSTAWWFDEEDVYYREPSPSIENKASNRYGMSNMSKSSRKDSKNSFGQSMFHTETVVKLLSKLNTPNYDWSSEWEQIILSNN